VQSEVVDNLTCQRADATHWRSASRMCLALVRDPAHDPHSRLDGCKHIRAVAKDEVDVLLVAVRVAVRERRKRALEGVLEQRPLLMGLLHETKKILVEITRSSGVHTARSTSFRHDDVPHSATPAVLWRES
jgi:hypothetical protein